MSFRIHLIHVEQSLYIKVCGHLHDELDTFWIDEARVREEALEERGNTREGTARHVIFH
jgi:hypothetical protein